jgi:hypothetical protein
MPWLVSTGFWDDDGEWDDAEFWNDGEPAVFYVRFRYRKTG